MGPSRLGWSQMGWMGSPWMETRLERRRHLFWPTVCWLGVLSRYRYYDDYYPYYGSRYYYGGRGWYGGRRWYGGRGWRHRGYWRGHRGWRGGWRGGTSRLAWRSLGPPSQIKFEFRIYVPECHNLKRPVRQFRPGRFFLHRKRVVPMLQRGGSFGMVRRDSPIKRDQRGTWVRRSGGHLKAPQSGPKGTTP